jgi:RNA polymerase sigma-70 factor (ECF subfamily)
MFARYANRPPHLGRQSLVPGCASFAADAEDSDLIAAARRGDAAAYASLVHKYQDRLCLALRRICRSLADAQDAAQEAYLRAYMNLGQYNGASSFYTWLYRIAVNAVINEFRRGKTRASREQSRLLPGYSRGGDVSSPDEPLLRQECVAQVRAALDALSTEHRTILVLREMEDCDYDEIAAVLAIPKGTVRSRLHRARLALREKLATLSELTSHSTDKHDLPLHRLEDSSHARTEGPTNHAL